MKSHKDIIERIGTTSYVAERLGIPAQRVSVFKRRGIPWKYRNAIKEIATFRLPSEFFTPDLRKGA